MELDKHRLRALNMRESRWRLRLLGWFLILAAVVLAVRAPDPDFGVAAVIASVATAACGLGVLALGRRRWRLEDSGYRPPRSFYVRSAAGLATLALGMFVAAGFFEALAGPLVMLGLMALMLGGFALVRVFRGPV